MNDPAFFDDFEVGVRSVEGFDAAFLPSLPLFGKIGVWRPLRLGRAGGAVISGTAIRPPQTGHGKCASPSKEAMTSVGSSRIWVQWGQGSFMERD